MQRASPGPSAGVGSAWFTAASVVALASGLGVRALNLLVIPLIVSLSVLAVFDTPEIGRVGARSLGVFATMLICGAALTCVIAPPIVALYRVDPAAMALLQTSTSMPGDLATIGSGGMSAWLQ